MVLGLKSHAHCPHPISSIPYPKPQAILNLSFKTRSFPHIQLIKSRRVNASSSSEVSINPGGGGGGPEDPVKDVGGDGDRDGDGHKFLWLFSRGMELLWRPDPLNVVGFSGTLGWVCAQVAWRLYLVMMEVLMMFGQISAYFCVGLLGLAFGVISITLLLL